MIFAEYDRYVRLNATKSGGYNTKDPAHLLKPGRRQLLDGAERRRRAALALSVGSPARDIPRAIQRARVRTTRGQLRNVAERRRRAALARTVVSPARNKPRAVDRAGMNISRRKLCDAAQQLCSGMVGRWRTSRVQRQWMEVGSANR